MLLYLVDDYWAPGKEIGIRANDPDLKVQWFFDKVNLSEKDQQNQSVKEAFPNKTIA